MSSIRRITKQNKEYPKLLKEIFKPPVLYVRGSFDKADDFALAVVGTRKPTHYGKQAASRIVYDLTKSGLTIVSGLALGIDTIVHKTALEAGGRTIAVLGSGVDDKSLYPQDNKKLACKIEKSGAVISEYPDGTSAKPGYFPQRNRIISGLCLGALIIEAGYKSGALITAHCALDQNREVFCVPGSIFSEKSAGANNLIKLGAKLVTSAKDVLEELNLTQSLKLFEPEKITADNKEEAKILKFLNHEPRHIDELIKKTKLNPSAINAALSMMEIKNKIKNIGGGNYVKAR